MKLISSMSSISEQSRLLLRSKRSELIFVILNFNKNEVFMKNYICTFVHFIEKILFIKFKLLFNNK